MAFSMGISIDSPGYGYNPDRPLREKRVKGVGDWTPEETKWANLWLKDTPYVESTFCQRCVGLVALLRDYENRDAPGWTPDEGGIAPLKCKIWKDLVLSSISGCHLCSLTVGSSWNAGEGPFDLFRWLRCADRTGELEIAMWPTGTGGDGDASSRPCGWALCGLQFGEELSFDSADDRESSWSNIWLFDWDQPRRLRSGRGFTFISPDDDQPPVPMCISTGDAEALRLAGWWLKRCRTEHSACSASTIKFVGHDRPARLLYVGANEDNEELRLHPNIDPHWRPEYVALSYCWGTTTFQHTTSKNIAEYSSKIDYSILPQTIQDAVDVTRQLGFCYLWIDALCIIQDSEEDWATESVKMGQVYRQATLTIAALAAQDSSRGCFLKRNPLCLRDCRIPGTRLRLSSTVWTMKREHQITGRFASPLQTRAWVVQEEYSSTRTLYFGSGGLWWQCITCEATESQPFGSLSHDYTGDGMPEGRFRTVVVPNGFASNPKHQINQVLTGDKTSPAHAGQFRSLWRDIVSRYTSCKLTYQSDKLVAISGIANLFERALGLEYKVGLWVSNLATELLWSSVLVSDGKLVSPKRSTSGAPSFSWASVEQPVKLFDRSSSAELEAEVIELVEQQGGESTNGNCTGLKVVSQLKRVWLLPGRDSGVTTRSNAIFTLSNDGETESPARDELDIQDDDEDQGGDVGYLVFTRQDKSKGSGSMHPQDPKAQKRVTFPWTPDIPLDTAPAEAWYLCLARYEWESLLTGTVGLILTPVDSSRRRWSRIGLAMHERLPLRIGENVATSMEDESGSRSQRLTARSHAQNPFLVDAEKDFEEVLIV